MIALDPILREYMQSQLEATPTSFHRYMYYKILWDQQLVGLIGPRGVGKSTLVKQYILAQSDGSQWLYVSADHLYFATHSLVELADWFVREGGRHLVIDEIHKYAGWSRELKQIYDVHPRLQVIFTGSSVLDIHKGEADLSRRALMFEMQGLSLREYLRLWHSIDIPVYTLDQIVAGEVKLPSEIAFQPLFRDYLARGYYPFSLQKGYHMRLNQVVTQTLENDIPMYAGMNVATARKLKQMLAIIAQVAPYKPSMADLSSQLHVSKNDVPDYLLYLQQAGMIGQLRSSTRGFQALGKVEKVYVDNPSLMTVLASGAPNLGNLRETFFYNQMRINYPITSSPISDFQIGDYTFEVGGHAKTQRQLAHAAHGIVVRDDISIASPPFIPLFHFGLTY